MYSPLHPDPVEVTALVERFRERKDLLPLKARGLKRLAVELKAVSQIGLPWKQVWRTLRDVGYQGTYRQFVRMTTLLTSEPRQRASKSKHFVAPCAERELRREVGPAIDRRRVEGEKPDWQRRREEVMARLDREAEENRARELRLSRRKIFDPPPFKGRGEE
jgi:hypothetical protein